MNLGVETSRRHDCSVFLHLFQHSLMNLGVETPEPPSLPELKAMVSAFSDESWGGDRLKQIAFDWIGNVSAFSDESWGGDRIR